MASLAFPVLVQRTATFAQWPELFFLYIERNRSFIRVIILNMERWDWLISKNFHEKYLQSLSFFESRIARLISYTVLKFPKIVLSWNFYWKSTWKICRISFRIKCIFKFHFIRGEKMAKEISWRKAFDVSTCKTSFPMRIPYKKPSTFHSQIHFFSFRP